MPDRALESTDRVTGSSLIRPPPVRAPASRRRRSGPAQPGRTRHVASLELDDRGPSTRCCPRPGARGRAPATSVHSPSTQIVAPLAHSASSSGAAGSRSSGLLHLPDRDHAHGHELDRLLRASRSRSAARARRGSARRARRGRRPRRSARTPGGGSAGRRGGAARRPPAPRRPSPPARRTPPRSSSRSSPSSAPISGPHEVAPHVGDGEPERAQHAARARDEHGRHAELLGQRARVHPAGAAERGEREVARVQAALDADHAQRAHHLGVGDAHDAQRRLLRVEPERLARRRQRALGQLAPQRRPRRRPAPRRRRAARGTGWRPSPSAPRRRGRSRRARARRPRSAGRRAARRPRRRARSSRRPR